MLLLFQRGSDELFSSVSNSPYIMSTTGQNPLCTREGVCVNAQLLMDNISLLSFELCFFQTWDEVRGS